MIKLEYYLEKDKKNVKKLSPFYFHFGAYTSLVNDPAKYKNSTYGGSSLDFDFRVWDHWFQAWDLDNEYQTGGMTGMRKIGHLTLTVTESKPDFSVVYEFEMRRIVYVAYRSMPLLSHELKGNSVLSPTGANHFFYEASINGVMLSVLYRDNFGGVTEKKFKPVEVGGFAEGAAAADTNIDYNLINAGPVRLRNNILDNSLLGDLRNDLLF